MNRSASPGPESLAHTSLICMEFLEKKHLRIPALLSISVLEQATERQPRASLRNRYASPHQCFLVTKKSLLSPKHLLQAQIPAGLPGPHKRTLAFPGSPVAKTPHSQWRDSGLIPGQGTGPRRPQLSVHKPQLKMLHEAANRFCVPQ